MNLKNGRNVKKKWKKNEQADIKWTVMETRNEANRLLTAGL